MEPVQSLESEFCHYHYLPLLHWTSYFSVLLLFLMCGMGVIAVPTPWLTVTTLKDLIHEKHLGVLL